MSQTKNALQVLLAILLLLAVPGALAADSDSDSDSDSERSSIVGSWEVVSEIDSGGDEVPGFFTFNADNTWMTSGSSVDLSNAHGAWERIGSRTFDGTTKGFIFGSDGSVSLLIKNTGVLEVSSDGNSLTFEFESTISLPDGTPISAVTGSGSGTRIQVE